MPRLDLTLPSQLALSFTLAATLTAGQLTLDSAGSLVVREGYMILKTLAQNAPCIVGTTLICLVIVIVRRRRAATHV